MFCATVLVAGVLGLYTTKLSTRKQSVDSAVGTGSISARASEEDMETATTALPVFVMNGKDFTDKELGNITADIPTSSFLQHMWKSGDRFVQWSRVRKEHLSAALALAAPGLVGSVMPLVVLVAGLVIWRFGCKGRKRTNFEEAPAKMGGNFSPIVLFGCCDMTRSGLLEWLCCTPCMWTDTVLRSGVFTRMNIGQLVLVLFVFMYGLPLLLSGLDTGLSSTSQLIGMVIFYVALFQARRRMQDLQELSAEGKVKEKIKEEIASTFLSGFCPSSVSAVWLQDLGSVVCCAPCAIAQEAQYEEIAEMAAPEEQRTGLLQW